MGDHVVDDRLAGDLALRRVLLLEGGVREPLHELPRRPWFFEYFEIEKGIEIA